MRRSLLAVVLILGLGAFSWLDRAPLLQGAADLWIVSDPLGPADAAVVLGGGIADRPFAAARYYQAGLVKRVLVSHSHEGPAVKLGVVISDAEAARQVLLQLGVPNDAIETFGTDLKNTNEEITALRDWADGHKAHSFIVATEIFSTRRVRWMLHRAFGDKAEITVPALEPAEYNRDSWWQEDQGILAFQNEIIKYIYYTIKY
jgi:uncharacterized SAM-binding protein YcdF (DUF218 family)